MSIVTLRPGKTFAQALNELPSTGGVIQAEPGRYDTEGAVVTKPLTFRSTVPAPRYLPSSTLLPIQRPGIVTLYTTKGNSVLTIKAGGFSITDTLFELGMIRYGVVGEARDGRVEDCYFFNPLTGRQDSTAVAVRSVYAVDASWWRIRDNGVMGAAICALGDAQKLDCNQHIVSGNVGFGLGLNNGKPNTVPAISVVGGHRCSVRDNNLEAYRSPSAGIRLDSCWDCRVDGDGGEYVDVFLDLVNTKGCNLAPVGQSYAALGSTTPYTPNPIFVRGDQYTKANVITVPTWRANDQRIKPHSTIQLASPENRVVSVAA